MTSCAAGPSAVEARAGWSSRWRRARGASAPTVSDGERDPRGPGRAGARRGGFHPPVARPRFPAPPPPLFLQPVRSPRQWAVAQTRLLRLGVARFGHRSVLAALAGLVARASGAGGPGLGARVERGLVSSAGAGTGPDCAEALPCPAEGVKPPRPPASPGRSGARHSWEETYEPAPPVCGPFVLAVSAASDLDDC